ncbi:hypothetical protein VFPPC_06662 [Pochonia chlamydosporia 170]|uniref:Uncharacterized protein n=1 Tax=Pochonia chlamydosporia 170 TaxID=1380566 RepID=A0A179F5Y5_METCM|nr:hypothetical protein VFPPC_06662 [Pochonia chlamydosporia 170]OAQ60529.1 hypothetical protein VFPPC_06662 [Pochonia chlamydosporia 170]
MADQSSQTATSGLTIFSLPREIRDDIWTQIVSHDMILLSGEHHTASIYIWPERYRPALTIFNLLLVSKAIKNEITNTFRQRYKFAFQNSAVLRHLLEHGYSYWGRSPQYGACPRVFFTMGHLSIIPRKKITSNSYIRHPKILPPNKGQEKRTLWCSSGHPHGYWGLDGDMESLLKYIHKSPMKLRSLEIPAALLFNVRIVRQLRRFRGVDLHFAFVPEAMMPKASNVQHDTGHQHRTVKWLAENGDADIVAPVYETQSDTTPIAVVPLRCIATAIRREVASRDLVPSRPSAVPQAEVDPPLWIECDEASQLTSTMSSLSPPTSGWYRYSGRDPGVVCLEKCTGPPFLRAPLKRKMLKRQRQEWGRQCAEYKPFHFVRAPERERTDTHRRWVIVEMGLQGVVVKHEWSRDRVPKL